MHSLKKLVQIAPNKTKSLPIICHLNSYPSMAQPLCLEFSHAVYHVTSRSNARQKIVRTDADRQVFLATLVQMV